MKNKETLEEVAERLTENAYQNEEWEKGRLKRIGYYQGLIDGGKWQQEQDKNKYSEEEVLAMLLNNPYQFENNIKEWFEQFKKKISYGTNSSRMVSRETKITRITNWRN